MTVLVAFLSFLVGVLVGHTFRDAIDLLLSRKDEE